MRWAVLVSEFMTTHAAVVLAAGDGARMKSNTPKVLHRICGEPMVSLAVASARGAGLDRIVVVVPQDSQPIMDVLGAGVQYAHQTAPLGTGHALLQSRPGLEDVANVVVLLGDVPLVRPPTLSKLVRLHNEREACITILTATGANADGLGRVVRSRSGSIVAIVEESEADESILTLTESNSGVYCFQSHWLWDNLPGISPSANGEVFLTDLVAEASAQGMPIESVEAEDVDETLGVNTRVHLAQAEAVMRQRIRTRCMLEGVTIPDPPSVFIDADVELGQDSTVLPNTHITGRTQIGLGCEIGPNSIVSDCAIGNDSKVLSSVVEGSVLEDEVAVGPFSHIRPGSRLEKGVRVGNYAEVKNSRLGRGTKTGHFSFIGDADVGANVNIGAGTVTCNYDGEKKNPTTIGDDAFIGCDSMLVAPINIGQGSVTGAGSVITKDVPPGALVKGVPARAQPTRRGKAYSQRRTPSGGKQ